MSTLSPFRPACCFPFSPSDLKLIPYLTPQRRARLELFRPTVRYLSGTEVHVYALAISASVLLSFFPFCNVMLSLCRNVLHSRAAEEAIYLAINDYFPGEMAVFLKHNLALQGRLQLTSMVLLLFTANGIFEPLEVALNRAWGEGKNRSYLKNQLGALGMIFLCGALALLSLMLTAANKQWISTWHWLGGIEWWLNLLMFKLAAIPISILALFLIYWLLPNRKIPPARVAPAAVFVGLILEALKYVNLATAPFLQAKLEREYSIFRHSVGILLWSFIAAMVVLAGAEWSARARAIFRAGARVLHLPPLGRDPAVELHRRHGGFGGRGMERASQAGRSGTGRSGIVVVMKNWAGIAQANGLALSARELDGIVAPLAALEETFRPLVKQLTPEVEPDLELHLSSEAAGEGE